MRPHSRLLRYMLKACVAQILLEKSYLNVENFLPAMSACRGAGCYASLWPCNKELKPNFQSIISQTKNDCSLLSLILTKLLLLDIRCKNLFALSMVTAITARPFSIKKCAKMSVFHVCENRKKSLAAVHVKTAFGELLLKFQDFKIQLHRFETHQCQVCF